MTAMSVRVTLGSLIIKERLATMFVHFRKRLGKEVLVCVNEE
ncbi:MAG: hypothetical protein R6U27_04040 [Desulfobacterales bacterium]